MSIPSLNTAFDIKELFEKVHGYRPATVAGLPDTAEIAELAQIAPNGRKAANIYGTPFYGAADLIGREVFCPITIEVAGKNYVFPFAVLGFRRSKTIVETEMTELDDTVKEIVGLRPIEITIKGFVIGQYEQFPDESIKMLNDVFEYKQTVRLKSAYSDIILRENDNVLIYDLDLPTKAAVIGVRDFSFQIKSDRIFTLYVD